jgi:hypothetical protein
MTPNPKTFQEAPGLATQAPRLPFNGEVANTIKSLPYVKDVIPGYTAQVQLNVAGLMSNNRWTLGNHKSGTS